MPKCVCWCALTLWLLPGTALAQSSGGPPTARARAAMGEDIEIMRRLLDRTFVDRGLFERAAQDCTACHKSVSGPRLSPDGRSPAECPALTTGWLIGNARPGSFRYPQSMAFNPDGRLLATAGTDRIVRVLDVATGKQLATPAEEAHSLPAAEGVYLKGHGVVFTATVRGPVVDSATLPPRPAPKPLDDWERVRRQLRGTETETAAGPAEPKEPPLREVLLKLLARHGHHFTQLGPRESLTVAVTFREPPAPAQQPGQQSQGGSGSPASTGSKGTGTSTASAPTSSRDLELLGDLHLKQHRAKEAMDAYSKAVSARPSGDDGTRRRLYRKLAQATLAYAELAPSDRAEKLLAGAAKFLQYATEPAAKSEPAAPPMRLPARLIVSATKDLLDQVAAGKVSFEEFRRGANVEFSPAATVQKADEAKAP